MLKKIHALLKDREFISVASCDLRARPNAAPKFLLKIEDRYMYLVDYSIGRTWENLKANPRLSLSFADVDTLYCYQINGSVEIIDSGPEYELIAQELLKKQVDLSIRRIMEGLTTQRTHRSFEAGIANRFVIFKVKIREIAETAPTGTVKREEL